jgi:hypothetical protein
MGINPQATPRPAAPADIREKSCGEIPDEVTEGRPIMQIKKFEGDNGFVIHKIVLPGYSGRFSAWFDKDRKLVDAEQFDRLDRTRAVKKHGPAWGGIEKIGQTVKLEEATSHPGSALTEPANPGRIEEFNRGANSPTVWNLWEGECGARWSTTGVAGRLTEECHFSSAICRNKEPHQARIVKEGATQAEASDWFRRPEQVATA